MRLWTLLTLVVWLGPGCIVVHRKHPGPHPHPYRHYNRHHVEVRGMEDAISP